MEHRIIERYGAKREIFGVGSARVFIVVDDGRGISSGICTIFDNPHAFDV
jgi:hypothetical protein